MGKSLRLPATMVLLMWAVFALQAWGGMNLAPLGILPRQLWGLIGIFTSPLVHGNVTHLVTNTFPILILGGILFFFYDKVSRPVFYISYFLTGTLIWVFGRPAFHIGASGVIYSLAFFVIMIGFLRKDFKSTIISFVVVILYGGLIFGLFPTQEGVSWEAHLIGAIVGVFSAIYYSTKRRISS
jgi:membrane associated rhomboid family serine protease